MRVNRMADEPVTPLTRVMPPRPHEHPPGFDGAQSGPAVRPFFSPRARLFSRLEELESRSPEKFKEVLQNIADSMHERAEAGGPGSVRLERIADRFDQAAETGDLSALRPRWPALGPAAGTASPDAAGAADSAPDAASDGLPDEMLEGTAADADAQVAATPEQTEADEAPAAEQGTDVSAEAPPATAHGDAPAGMAGPWRHQGMHAFGGYRPGPLAAPLFSAALQQVNEALTQLAAQDAVTENS